MEGDLLREKNVVFPSECVRVYGDFSSTTILRVGGWVWVGGWVGVGVVGVGVGVVFYSINTFLVYFRTQHN
jgi:hypothetical protein